MPHLNYDYKKKKITDDRKDYQAIFMINQNTWKSFKEYCASLNKTPSEVLRCFINSKV